MKQNTKWRCPSNIAITKYWGKAHPQRPLNSSLSMTLKNCFTDCEVSLKKSSNFELSIIFNDELLDCTDKKYLKIKSWILREFIELKSLSLTIKTTNNFPHGAGIASSASGFGALALALKDLCWEACEYNSEFFKQASDKARLGSGSACRSIFGGFVEWRAEAGTFQNAQVLHEVSPKFKELKDAILIVSSAEKKVSSSEGHALMDDHDFKKERISLANARTAKLKETLSLGDWKSFQEVCESEALGLHAMMMTSNPSFILLEPNSLKVINAIKELQSKGHKATFTIDAGPNIHLLYLKESQSEVHNLIDELLSEESIEKVIFDEMGTGPCRL